MVMKSKLDNYERLEKVGEGAYGIVYKAIEKSTNIPYAMKEISFESISEGIPTSSIREIGLLKDLQHPNIVKIKDVIHGNQMIIIVFEYVKYDLKKFFDIFGKQVDSRIVKSLLYQLIRGIAHCHQNKVLHRDLKPQNLLVSEEGVLKLGDFGLAKAFGIPIKNFTNVVVTLWYRAPDVLLGSTNYSTSVDIWSIGCIFAEMINQAPLFPGVSEQDQLNQIFQVLGTPNADGWPALVDLPNWKANNFMDCEGRPLNEVCPGLDSDGLDLLDKMLKLNPSERISAKDALSHPFFRDIPDNLKKLYY